LSLTLTSLLTCWLFLSEKNMSLALITLGMLILQSGLLIHYMNATNRKIAFFFDAVKNEDSSLHFTEKGNIDSLNELHRSLNRVNELIQETRLENIRQEQFYRILMEHASTGIIAYDEKGFVSVSNATARKIFGLEVFTHLNQLERVDGQLPDLFRNMVTGEQKLITLTNERGTQQISVKSTKYKQNDKPLMILSFQDIGGELDEKEIESWIRLIRVMTHEIMNSIAPITSLSETLSS
ncbi:MAG: hypothetical protein Q8862_02505, partial [Bacteroidota bacterium]|nr:hypothetical protein [Bacteroidota bacterium]